MHKNEKPSVSSNSAYIEPRSRTGPVNEVLEKKEQQTVPFQYGKGKSENDLKIPFGNNGTIQGKLDRTAEVPEHSPSNGQIQLALYKLHYGFSGSLGGRGIHEASVSSLYLPIIYLILPSIHPSIYLPTTIYLPT